MELREILNSHLEGYEIESIEVNKAPDITKEVNKNGIIIGKMDKKVITIEIVKI